MISVFSMDPEQRTNCLRRAFIFWFYNIRIGEPPVWLLTLTTTKTLSFISNIDGRTCYYNPLYFYLSWFFTDPEQRTNYPWLSFIFRFYKIGIGEPRVRVLNLTITKSLSFMMNIDGPVTTTVSIFIWVGFPQIPSNEQSCCWSRYQKIESKTL